MIVTIRQIADTEPKQWDVMVKAFGVREDGIIIVVQHGSRYCPMLYGKPLYDPPESSPFVTPRDAAKYAAEKEYR